MKIDKTDWSVYWQTGQISSTAVKDDKGNDVFEEFWGRVSSLFGRAARILDIGTGNGYVPLLLTSSRKDISITAVDFAKIDYSKIIKRYPELGGVNFLPNIDVSECEFWNNAPDYHVIVSQFGIEYAGIFNVFELIFSKDKFAYLDVALIIHMDDSEIASKARKNIEEINLLLSDDGILSRLRKDLDNMSRSFNINVELEFLSKLLFRKVGSVSFHVVQMCKYISENYRVSNLDAFLMLDELEAKLTYERNRNMNLVSVALSESDVNRLKKELEKNNFFVEVDVLTGVFDGVDKALAWSLTARNYGKN